GLFAAAFALPQQHTYKPATDADGRDRSPLGQLRAVLDEMVEAGALDHRRRDGIEHPVWATVHGMAVLTGQGPLRTLPDDDRESMEELALTFIASALS